MRSALAAVANLEQLLRSRNVAPKSIAQVLPDLEHCCSGLVADFEALRQALPGALAASSPAAVRDYLAQQVYAFETAIRGATRRTLNAAGRLRLEGTVVEVSSNLAGLLPLAAPALADDRPDHFKGQPAQSLEQALTNLSEYNAKLQGILAQEQLSAKDSHQVHELTYTLENALERIDDELEELAETLEALHVASETAELDKVRALGATYLDKARPIVQ